MTSSRGKRPPTAQEVVLAGLRRAILGGEMPPGSPVFQDEIANEFGVSRVPVREALRILEGERLIAYSPHRGYHVMQLDIGELLEIQHIRGILEAEALKYAVGRFDDEAATEMGQNLERMAGAEEQGDYVTWVAVHREFHFRIFRAAEMPHLVRILGHLWDASDLYRSQYMQLSEARARTQREHFAIYRAAMNKELDELLRLMDEHRASTVETIRSSLLSSAQEI